MIKNALLLSLLAVGTSVSAESELSSVAAQPRKIVGGTIASVGRYPFQVGLIAQNTFFCGGSLISPSVVLSAAHCLDAEQGGTVPDFVIVGCTDLNNLNTPGCEAIAVENGNIFPAYNRQTFSGDFAIITLQTPSANVPVTLALPGLEIEDPQDLTVIGWGTTSFGGAISIDLLEVDVPFVPTVNGACVQQGGIDGTMICAGVAGKDACQGDSGGPLFLNCEGGDLQLGVVSFGNQCALNGFPGVYGDVRFSGAVSFIEDSVAAQGESLTTIDNIADFCSDAASFASGWLARSLMVAASLVVASSN